MSRVGCPCEIILWFAQIKVRFGVISKKQIYICCFINTYHSAFKTEALPCALVGEVIEGVGQWRGLTHGTSSKFMIGKEMISIHIRSWHMRDFPHGPVVKTPPSNAATQIGVLRFLTGEQRSHTLHVKVKITQSCSALWDSMGYRVCGILQARILERVAFPFSRGSSQARDQTQVSHTVRGFFTSWDTREAQAYWSG